MRIPGSNFSASYDKLLQLNTALADEMIEDHLLEWSRDTVELLKEVFPTGKFKVEIIISPDLSDGKDSVRISIWQMEDTSFKNSLFEFNNPELGTVKQVFKPFTKVFSGPHPKISECIREVNEKLDKFVKVLDNSKSNIIEINGKKYKLIEG